MTIAWETPSSWPRLSDDEIHVWCVELDAAGEEAALAACLSEEERERASGLLSGTHQRRFVVARGMLRQLLGRYLDQDPGAVAFSRGAHGKPFLQEGGLHFNVSHTHELALYAIARDREVGVDVEWMRPQVAHEQIAARFFSLEEQEALAQVPDEERRDGFLQHLDAQGSLMSRHGATASPLASALLRCRWERRQRFCIRTRGGRIGAVEVGGFGTGGRIRRGFVRGWRGLAAAVLALAALESDSPSRAWAAKASR